MYMYLKRNKGNKSLNRKKYSIHFRLVKVKDELKTDEALSLSLLSTGDR